MPEQEHSPASEGLRPGPVPFPSLRQGSSPAWAETGTGSGSVRRTRVEPGRRRRRESVETSRIVNRPNPLASAAFPAGFAPDRPAVCLSLQSAQQGVVGVTRSPEPDSRVRLVQCLSEAVEVHGAAGGTGKVIERILKFLPLPHILVKASPGCVGKDRHSIPLAVLVRRVISPKAKIGYFSVWLGKIMHRNENRTITLRPARKSNGLDDASPILKVQIYGQSCFAAVFRSKDIQAKQQVSVGSLSCSNKSEGFRYSEKPSKQRPGIFPAC